MFNKKLGNNIRIDLHCHTKKQSREMLKLEMLS